MRKLWLKNIAAIALMFGVGGTAFAQWAIKGDYVLRGSVLVAYQGNDTAVNIPANLGITDIGEKAFSGNDRITSVIIPQGVTYIGEEAFAGCIGMTSVTIPASVDYISDRAFVIGGISATGHEFRDMGGDYLDSVLTAITVDPRNPRYRSIDGVLFDKDDKTLIRYPPAKTGGAYTIPTGVYSIKKDAFHGCSLTNITISSSVMSIDEGAFVEGGWNLTAITVDPSNTAYRSIDGVLFDKAGKTLIQYPIGKIGSYTIPSSVTSIGNYAFYGSRLTSVTIPSSVTSIGNYAFYSCKLTSVTIPSSVAVIGKGAFGRCGLTSATILPGIAIIGNSAFRECWELKSVTIPTSVTYIEDHAFSGCSGLMSVTIPSSVTAIRDYAFSNCNMTSITIPTSVTYIEDHAFSGCDKLTVITVDPRNQNYSSIDGVLFDKAGKTLIRYPPDKIGGAYAIPAGVVSIGNDAFLNCRELTGVTIPQGVSYIGNSAFGYSGLTSVTIPSSVTSIGNYAFCGSVLTSVTIPSSVVYIGNYAFSNCYNLKTATLSRRTQVAENAFPEEVRLIYSDQTGAREASSQPASAVPADFVRVSGGTFTMGSPASEPERFDWEGPQHSVTIASFYISKYEVTQKDYLQIMGTNPSRFKGDTLPVEQVSWFDAIAYCNLRSQREGLTPAYAVNGSAVTWNRTADGYRLPTEAEWEYACRAGTTAAFHTGNSITTLQANINANRGQTWAVNAGAANPWGLYNMHGNVWEWCWDWYGLYSSAVQTDPVGAEVGLVRIVRGGSWNYAGQCARSAYRHAFGPTTLSGDLGFRLVRPADTTLDSSKGRIEGGGWE